MRANRWWVAEELPDAIVRTPGARLGCAGDDAVCRKVLARATAQLYGALARCDAASMVATSLDRAALETCRATAMARFGSRAAARCASCTTDDRDVIAAQTASLVDGFVGAWFCAR